MPGSVLCWLVGDGVVACWGGEEMEQALQAV